MDFMEKSVINYDKGKDERTVIAFKWRDRTGKFHDVTEMATKHLFHTLLMIWNHSVPQHLRIEPYIRYRFDEFYNAEYITQAMRALSRELRKRINLTPYEVKCLNMIDQSGMTFHKKLEACNDQARAKEKERAHSDMPSLQKRLG